MFEFMDGVVDAMEETGKVVVDGVVYCLICVAKLALIITAPVWALPYTIWRKGRGMSLRALALVGRVTLCRRRAKAQPDKRG